ncbi:MAG: hypothetical protein AAF432_04440 [Planctomycetota bacterium]
MRLARLVILIMLTQIVAQVDAGVLENSGSVASGDAAIAWMNDASPNAALAEGDVSIIAWLRQRASDRAPGAMHDVLSVADHALLRMDYVDEALVATLPLDIGVIAVDINTLTDDGTTAGLLPADAWMLVAVSWTAPTGPTDTGVLTVHARCDAVSGTDASGILGYRSATATAPIGASVTTFASDVPFRFGSADGLHWRGARSVVVRNHAITADDFNDIWQQRSITSAFQLDNTALGENRTMTGVDGAVWTAGMFQPTNPTPDQVELSAALPNDPVTENNVVVFSASAAMNADSIQTARPTIVGADSNFRHRDVYGDAELGGFFVPFADQSAALTRTVAGTLGLSAASFASDDDDEVHRIVSWSNSRGTNTSSAKGRTLAEQHSQGFIDLRRERQIGGLNYPVYPFVVPMFGQNGLLYGGRWSDGHVETFAGTSFVGHRRMFQRMWTGGGIYAPVQGALGASSGDLLFNGGAIQLMCHPEPGSRLTHTDDLIIEIYVLMHGIATRVEATPVKSPRMDTEGQPIGPTSIVRGPPIDRFHIMRFIDIQIATDTLLLSGDWGGIVKPGQLMLVEEDVLNYNTLNKVENVVVNEFNTTVTFEHDFPPIPTIPRLGSKLTFGDVQVQRLRFRVPGLDAGDPNVCRGIKLRNIGRGIAAVYAMSFYRADSPGELHGPAGWGGAGYVTQIPAAFSGALERTFELVDPDVVLAFPADQLTEPTWWIDAVDRVQAGAPEADIVLVAPADMSPVEWDQTATDDAFASTLGVFGVSVRDHPNLGNKTEMYARFAIKDTFHWSALGNELIAEAILDRMRGWADSIARTCSADVDPVAPSGRIGNATVDIDDLLAIINGIGLPSQRLDLTKDGVVGIDDVIETIISFGSCPDAEANTHFNTLRGRHPGKLPAVGLLACPGMDPRL